MIHTTESARQAKAKMDERFATLQAIYRRMDDVRATGTRVEYALYVEWESAYQRFQRAHDEWKKLVTLPLQLDGNPPDAPPNLGQHEHQR